MLSKALIAIGLVITLLVGVPYTSELLRDKETKEEIVELYKEDKISKPTIQIETGLVKEYNVKKIITLQAKNTVVFRGPVTEQTVSDVMRKMTFMSRRLKKHDVIFLAIDSPGGSIFDGLDFIQFAKALPQKVNTVTLFAASMGFMMVQTLDKRYIVTNGTLMSHRASIGRLSGQINGELESRYKMVKRAVDYLEHKSSTRMSLSMKDYQSLINPEYWVHGFDAVDDKAADEQILIRCGKSLDGTEKVKFTTFYGPVTVLFSKCPLIKAPIKINLERISQKNKKYVAYVFNLAFRNKIRFIEEFISRDNMQNFHKVFPSN